MRCGIPSLGRRVVCALVAMGVIVWSPAGLPEQLSPTRWWGHLSYGYREERAEGEAARQHLTTMKVNASTYLWRPWFAHLEGGVGVTMTDSRERDGGTEGEVTTGDIRLRLLPLSRFPFEAYAEVLDSRVDSQLTGQALRSQRFGAMQRYRTLAGNTDYLVRFDRSETETTQSSSADARDTQDTLQFEANHRMTAHDIQVVGSFANNRRPTTDEEVTTVNTVARDRYNPDQTFSMETMASVTQTDNRLVGAESRLKFTQLTSYAFWRPLKRPLTVTAGARLYGVTNDTGGADSRVRTANVNLGANYQYTPNLRLTGSANATQTDTNGVQNLATDQALGATYQSDERPMFGSRYLWFASGSLSNRTDQQQTDSQHLSTQIGHSLMRDLRADAVSRRTLNLGQTLTMDRDTEAPSTQRLAHTAALTWQRNEQWATSYMRLSASDSRSLDDTNDVFQMVNLQLSRYVQSDRVSSWAGNLTMQALRQATATQPSAGFDMSSSGELTYRHMQAFGVPRLRFTSELRLNSDALVPVLARADQESRSWENRLDYSIGRLDMQLSLRLAEYADKPRQLLMFRISRRFGNH